jgi:hypothetical protein
MPKFAPKVVDGTRGPRDTRMEEMRAQSEAGFDATPAVMPKVDGTVYLSAYPGYMVQISAPADITDPLTGRKTIGRPVVARFVEGRYVNNARDQKLRDYVDEEMQRKTRFGKPGTGADYWLAEDAVRMAQAAAKASAATTLRSLAKQNPAELERLIAELRQGSDTDVKMPAPPAGPAA